MELNELQNWEAAIEEYPISPKLKETYKANVRNILERNGVVIISPEHFSSLVGIEEEVMLKMINQPSMFYRSFEIPKRKGGTRVISAPTPVLMYTQKWIYENILKPQTVLSDNTVGFVPGKSIVDNASPHLGNKYLLKIDLKDFFPSIKIGRVISVFKGLGYFHRTSYCLASLCCKDGCLPQGAPTSPIISNIVAKRLDSRLIGLCKKYQISYTRYADDLTFSGDYISVKFLSIVTDIIETEGFLVNESKTKILGEKSKKIITGVSISSGKTTIPRALKRKIRQETYYVHRFGIKNHMKHNNIKDIYYPMRLKGYLAYWNSVEGINEKVKNLILQFNGDLRSRNNVFSQIKEMLFTKVLGFRFKSQ